MSALEDSLRKVYKLPSVTTESTRPSFRGKTGRLTTKQEIGDEIRSMTGAVMTAEDEKRFLFDALQGAKGTMPNNRVDNFLLTREMIEDRPAMENLPLDPNSTPEITPLGELPGDKDPMDEMDAETKQRLDELLGKAAAQQMAPMAPLAQQLKAAGTGEDTALAHLRPGEIVIPPEFMEDEQFEGALERKFREFNINPEEAVVGMGIASLNPQTGLEQFGFFKKIFKGIKKVVKKVAPVAMLIPGVGTALGGVLGGIGGLATKIPGIGGALGSIGSTVAGGIAKLGIPGISSIAGGTLGGFKGIPGALTTKAGLFGGGPFSGLAGAPDYYAGGPGSDPQSIAKQQVKTQLEQARAQAVASGNMEDVAKIDAYLNDPANQAAQLGPFGGTIGPRIAQGIGGILGGQGVVGGGGGGFGDFAKMAGIGALAAKLGQLAKEDAEKQKGVPLTPMVMESPTGRYNLEAEIARRQGLAAPNPVEFGLLPEGTIPELSGGQPRMAAMGGAIEEIDVVRGAPTELIPNIAANVLQNLRKKSGAQFTESEVEMEIVRQLRPYTGNMVSEREIKEVRQAMFPTKNMMYGGAVEDLTGGMARGLREGGAAEKMRGLKMRAERANNVINELENTFNPNNIRDLAASNLPFDPTRIENMLMSAEKKEYDQAKYEFMMPILRMESGAQISESEIDWMNRTYFPQLGDDEETIMQKRLARQSAVESLMSEQKPQSKGIASMPAMMYGGPVMAYAQGGAVQMQEGGGMDPSQFPRMDGDINGPGTETSDDIPAMLSDGEFVMTGQAVRGAGSYDMAMDPKGIISLVPSFEENRERGMDLMYKMMDAFSTGAESS
jgi:hypothetical protein